LPVILAAMNVLRFRGAMLARILRVTGSVGFGLGAVQACSRSELPLYAVARGGEGGAGGAPVSSSSAQSSSSGEGGGFVVSSAVSSTGPGMTTVDAGGTCVVDVDGGVPLVACFPLANAGCPAPSDALPPLQGVLGPCMKPIVVCGGPFGQGQGDCCYDIEAVNIPCYVGRTFFLDEGTLRAELRDGGGWHAPLRPDVRHLSAATRAALAEAWARDGVFEHASVASFCRFSMQLLALGAPAELVRDVHAGAIDEVRHAELCLGLASAYAGRTLEPGPLPFPASVTLDAELASVAAESAMEGCIGETVAAVQAFDALASATDPAVIAVLETTVADETRHAELGWRFIAWALDAGGEDVRAAVIRAFSSFRPAPPRVEDLGAVSLDDYAAHGRQPATVARAIAEETLRDVVGPALCALLGRRRTAPEEARIDAVA
jgi:hypothetical protein